MVWEFMTEYSKSVDFQSLYSDCHIIGILVNGTVFSISLKSGGEDCFQLLLGQLLRILYKGKTFIKKKKYEPTAYAILNSKGLQSYLFTGRFFRGIFGIVIIFALKSLRDSL